MKKHTSVCFKLERNQFSDNVERTPAFLLMWL